MYDAKKVLAKMKLVSNCNTNVEFAEKFEIPLNTVSNWVKRNVIPLELISELVEQNDLSYDYFFKEEKNINEVIVINSLFYRLLKKKDDDLSISISQSLLIFMQKCFTELLDEKRPLTEEIIFRHIGEYKLTNNNKDNTTETITSFTIKSTMLFLSELEEDEIYFVCKKPLDFLHILSKAMIWYNKNPFGIDNPLLEK